MADGVLIADLKATLRQAASDAEAYFNDLRRSVALRVAPGGKVDRKKIDEEQRATHGLAWVLTYVETLKETANWADRIDAEGKFGEIEQLLCQILFGEYLYQLGGGLPMTQLEIVRPSDMTQDSSVVQKLATPAILKFITQGNTAAARMAAAKIIRGFLESQKATVEYTGLEATFEEIRDQFRAFGKEVVEPFAHEWHLKDELIPDSVVKQMGEMGVFGLTIPEEFGGLGLGKTSMCVVSEELSRAYIGVGSLGTRSEIAAELLLNGGTRAQQEKYLPGIASGEILPTAVFTEPNTGSDLGSLRTRAVRDGDNFKITGNKTWITHAARADLMTVLARSKADTKDHTGLSMFICEKPRGEEGNPFPADGMTGGEIEVLGYRGMKEYELGFDGFEVPASNLLGEVEGLGFKHLMATFEGARIQTAARAIGVAQCALELGLKYTLERTQFGRQIFDFPRSSDKLVMMAAELVGVRQLTYFSARQKDAGKRCDLEAGLAKMLAARIAWSAADNALQVHGGNGFALEYPISRVLCDARILNIFEGAGEVQAMVIARRTIDEFIGTKN
ncbi:MAG TPA: acyl-CoA dehydrogenase family protein [Hyphomonadaceae bacterium]|jgi:(2S)-methylsuccinyl-CoA dehydrogenase|nr:acyl-CoA dehydrogenase family protein [Hyphomonadaceae bacterium]